MDKIECIKYIMKNSVYLTEIDKLNLLRNMHRRKLKIHEGADGSRVWLDRLPMTELWGIKNYIQKVMERDSKYFLNV
jgi:hypothetical protein